MIYKNTITQLYKPHFLKKQDLNVLYLYLLLHSWQYTFSFLL